MNTEPNAAPPKLRLLDWFFLGYRAAWDRLRSLGDDAGDPPVPSGAVHDELAIIAHARGWRQAAREFRAGKRRP